MSKTNRRQFLAQTGASLALVPLATGVFDADGQLWRRRPEQPVYEGVVYLYGRVWVAHRDIVGATPDDLRQLLARECGLLTQDFVRNVYLKLWTGDKHGLNVQRDTRRWAQEPLPGFRDPIGDAILRRGEG